MVILVTMSLAFPITQLFDLNATDMVEVLLCSYMFPFVIMLLSVAQVV